MYFVRDIDQKNKRLPGEFLMTSSHHRKQISRILDKVHDEWNKHHDFKCPDNVQKIFISLLNELNDIGDKMDICCCPVFTFWILQLIDLIYIYVLTDSERGVLMFNYLTDVVTHAASVR